MTPDEAMRAALSFLARTYSDRMELLELSEKVYAGRRNPCRQALMDHKRLRPHKGDDPCRDMQNRVGFAETAFFVGCIGAEMLISGQWLPPEAPVAEPAVHHLPRAWVPSSKQRAYFHKLRERLTQDGQWPKGETWAEIEKVFA